MYRKIGKAALAIVLVFALTVGVMIFTSVLQPVQATAEEKTDEKGNLSVSGSFTVKVSPDIAYITIGINTFAVDPKDAQKENREKMDQVFEKLVALGIDSKDIQTMNYSITPRYEYKNIEEKDEYGNLVRRGESVLTGYNVDNTIRVNVRDLQIVGDVIDVTVDEGINKANSIAFGISDAVRDAKYLEALKGAAEAAKAKAETLAEVYGIQLDIPYSVVEGSSYIPSPIYRNLDYAAWDKGIAAANESVSTPIAAGEMEISANVTVVYKY
ncbi:MAG TPA: SIMPL domain-containing protein [Clostridiaceae bacterium]|nr:SIMPL domain-containing protein [Clostridiaceae bacterium]